MKHQPNKRPRGRPLMRGERMLSRSLALPPSLWLALDDQAHSLRLSTSELIRRKLEAKTTNRRTR